MSAASNSEYRSPLCRYLPGALLLVLLSLVVYARIRLLQLPLERDEGEFAYIGQLLLKGIPPYVQAYSMKTPGVAALYALLMAVFGQSASGIHLGLLVVNGISAGLVYLLAQRLMDRYAAVVACASYALFSFSQSVMGFAAHATHFVNLFILLGLVLLLQETGKRHGVRLFMAGICFGLAVVMKQHAVMLCLFAFLYLVRADRRHISRNALLARCGLLFLGIIAPCGILALACAMTGVFSEFWFWTVTYAFTYASALSPLDGMYYLVHALKIILSWQFPLVALAAAGLGIILFREKREEVSAERFIPLLLLFSFLSICPGFYFRPHYFVLLLPATALLGGYAATTCINFFPGTGRNYKRLVMVTLPVILIVWGVYNERHYLFTWSPREVSRKVNGINPFVEAVEIARYIKSHTSPEDRIAVLGSEPEIYFYADRLSATGHIYMYGLMENHPHAESMQIRMIREITAGMPKYIVKADIPYSWLVQQGAPLLLFNWMDDYLKQNYQVIGVADIISADTTRYVWDLGAESYTPESGSFLTIYKRRDGA